MYYIGLDVHKRKISSFMVSVGFDSIVLCPFPWIDFLNRLRWARSTLPFRLSLPSPDAGLSRLPPGQNPAHFIVL